MQDRELAARVRSLALNEMEKVLKNPKHVLYGPILVKLAGTVLPKLNEHSGPDGGDIPIPLLGGISNANKGNDSDKQTPDSQEED